MGEVFYNSFAVFTGNLSKLLVIFCKNLPWWGGVLSHSFQNQNFLSWIDTLFTSHIFNLPISCGETGGRLFPITHVFNRECCQAQPKPKPWLSWALFSIQRTVCLKIIVQLWPWTKSSVLNIDTQSRTLKCLSTPPPITTNHYHHT